MKSFNSMSLSFTMLAVCLHISTQAPVPIFTEIFIGEFTKICEYSSFYSSGTIIDTSLKTYMNF